jgi:hypothetical protein
MKLTYKDITSYADLNDIWTYLDSMLLKQITAQRLNMPGKHASLYIDDELIGAGGISQHWRGVGDAWLVVTPNGWLYRFSLYKGIKKCLHNWMQELGLWRVEAVIKAEQIYGPSHRLMNHLNFQFEGTQSMFGPDKSDYHRYALLRN